MFGVSVWDFLCKLVCGVLVSGCVRFIFRCVVCVLCVWCVCVCVCVCVDIGVGGVFFCF